LDNGSPVSFSAYRAWFTSKDLIKVNKFEDFNGVNKSVITIFGKIIEEIGISQLPNAYFI